MSQLAKTFRLSQIPLYIQVGTALRRRIEEGHWAPGEKISTIEELQAEFGVARVTVRQAVELLEKEGLVRRQQGRGTFVAPALEDRRWLRLDASWSSLIGTIKESIPKFLPVDAPPATPRLRPGEGALADDYVYLRSLQSRSGRIFALAGVHLAKAVFERDREAFRRHPALPVLAAMPGVAVASAHQTMVIGSADPETARLLRLPLNAPTAEAHCVVLDAGGIALYVADIIYRGDCVVLYTDFVK
jgi:GntR family transcriptional regulator